MNYKNNPKYEKTIVPRGKGQVAVYKRKQEPSNFDKTLKSDFCVENHKDLQFAKEIVDIFKKEGMDLFLVGGGVRDHLTGAVIDDFDFATPVPAEKIKTVAEKVGDVWEIGGERHGTIAFNYGDEKIEVTTFRTDIYDGDRKNPEVEFVDDIETDLARRDFTINAMSMDFNDNTIIDPFGGKEHLESKILETPGHSYDRLLEDPLRVDRAIRFCARDGFEMSNELKEAVIKIAEEGLMKEISRERHTSEIKKINKSGSEALINAISLAEELGAFDDMFDEDIEDTENLKQDLLELKKPHHRIIALLMHGGNHKKMKIENDYAQTAYAVKEINKIIDSEDDERTALLLGAYQKGYDAIEYLADVGNENALKVLQDKNKFEKKSESYVKGGEIMKMGESLGMKAGPWINEIKSSVDEAFIRSNGTLSKEFMLSEIKKKLEEL